MSQPRSILPGSIDLLTRRVLRRHLLLRPDAATPGLILYALAVSAQRFLHVFHRLVALGTKVLRAWEGPVWDPELTRELVPTWSGRTWSNVGRVAQAARTVHPKAVVVRTLA